jgi:hypothetical protein
MKLSSACRDEMTLDIPNEDADDAIDKAVVPLLVKHL